MAEDDYEVVSTDPLAGVRDPSYAESRAKFSNELTDDPSLVQRLFSLTHNEVGDQTPADHLAFLESVFNRATSRGQSLHQTINDRGYYPAVSFKARPGSNYSQSLAAVLDGSNVSQGATGNASGSVGFAGGPTTFSAGSGERYGIEGPDLEVVSRDPRAGLIRPEPAQSQDQGSFTPPPVNIPSPTLSEEVGSPPDNRSTIDKIMALAKTPSPDWLQPTEKFLKTPLVEAGTIADFLKSQQGLPNLQALRQGKVEVPPEPPVIASSAGQGIAEGAGEAISQFTSPAMAATAPFLGASGVVGRAVAGAFTLQGLAQYPDLFRQYQATDDPKEKARLITTAAILASPALGLRHGTEGAGEAAPAEKPTPAQSTTPETATQPAPSVDVKGTPEAARFRGVEVPTTADITRQAADWQAGLTEEGRQLGVTVEEMRQGGIPVPKPLSDRIDAINAELKAGFQPEEPSLTPRAQENIGAEIPDEPITEGGDVNGEKEIKTNTDANVQGQNGETLLRKQAAVPPGTNGAESAQTGTEAEPVRGTQADVAEARQDLGMAPYERELARTWGKAAEEARQHDTRYPGADQKLAQNLASKPRPVTDREHVSLLRNWQKAELEHKTAVDAFNSASAAEKGEAGDRLAFTKDRLQEAFNALDKTGSAAGRGFNIRKMILKEFYTPEAMEARFRAAKGGKALSEKEAKQLNGHVKDIQEAGRGRVKVQQQMDSDARFAEKAQESVGKKTNGAKSARDVHDILKTEAEAARSRLIKERGKVEWTKEIEPCIL